MIAAAFGLVVALIVLLALLVGVGVGVGLLLEWLLAVERSIAILVGVASTGFCVQLLVHLVREFPSRDATELPEQDLPDVVITPLWHPLGHRKRKRKP